MMDRAKYTASPAEGIPGSVSGLHQRIATGGGKNFVIIPVLYISYYMAPPAQASPQMEPNVRIFVGLGSVCVRFGGTRNDR